MSSINVKFESRSAKDNFRVATTSYELARRASEEWEIEHHCITGIVFTAFSIEAMLNHFGRILFNDWDANKLNRNASHKKLFREVNLPNYLGTKVYQTANNCFVLRDLLAHGKTIEETIIIDVPDDIGRDKVVHKVTSIRSKAHRNTNCEVLETFIETAKNIEKDIQDNGFYPNQTHLPKKDREKLLECPLSVSGIHTW